MQERSQKHTKSRNLSRKVIIQIREFKRSYLGVKATRQMAVKEVERAVALIQLYCRITSHCQKKQLDDNSYASSNLKKQMDDIFTAYNEVVQDSTEVPHGNTSAENF